MLDRKTIDTHHKQAGWALIETMLAVAVLVFIISTMLYIFQRFDQQSAAQRAAQEYNIVLAAAISYYHDHHEGWPTDVDPDLVPDYILKTQGTVHGDDQNTWRQPFVLHLTGTAISKDSKTDLELGSCVPGLKKAQAIAALLPHGRVDLPGTDKWHTPLNCTGSMHAVTTRIATLSGNKKFHFDVGIYKVGASIYQPACLHGTQPTVFVTPLAMDTGGHPISAMSAYATAGTAPDGKKIWVGHVQVITDEGLVTDTPSPSPSPSPSLITAKILVIRDCTAS